MRQPHLAQQSGFPIRLQVVGGSQAGDSFRFAPGLLASERTQGNNNQLTRAGVSPAIDFAGYVIVQVRRQNEFAGNHTYISLRANERLARIRILRRTNEIDA
jgi:hypothetical protein